ncbi:DNA-binding IclR family transcriptional regulator [Aequitasia blattaphilus]|uniref:IclR family transcriptional regulator n=1 Tax=Aequitasia blattaphilus TaxID=2949332 RepID=A0ABT1E517_9FIRM|nr:IclR family transcriptional regulator [Aequitasia blattaphilus]MCP1100928.1 IclR family transcriptional regulator [Aequitasia blattaphilus]MCR8613568.1 IclR family transcriptional regulator [Aequitasia blattaphilus]
MEMKSNPIQVADKLFAVIELLAAKGSMGLIDISNDLDLNKTTVHRLLNSLVYMGYVFQNPDTHKYRLGFKICGISNQILNQIDITRVVRPYLKELVNLTGETVHLVQLDGINAVYIDKIESTTNSIRLVSQLGKQLPLYSSGVGKALMADMMEEKVVRIWEKSEVKKVTEHTITDFAVLQKELKEIRSRGYAIDNEENEEGIRCVAASLETKNAGSSYAFSISAPIYRMDENRIKEIANHILTIKGKIQEAIS